MKQNILTEQEINVITGHVANRVKTHANVSEHILKTIIKQLTIEALDAINDDRKKRGE